MRKTVIFIVLSVFALTFFPGCETIAPQKEPPPKPPAARLPLEEQNKLAFNTYNDMLDLTAGRLRREVADELEVGYYKIIEEAPDTYLAEESHFRLVIHYFEHHEGPKVEKAEEIYRLYFERYKKPRLGVAITTTMARMYYNYQQWEQLAVFSRPFVKKYVETGEIKEPLFLFYYAESHFQIKDYGEAVKGFRLLIRSNPGKVELDFARKRILEVRHIMDQSIKKEQ